MASSSEANEFESALYASGIVSSKKAHRNQGTHIVGPVHAHTSRMKEVNHNWSSKEIQAAKETMRWRTGGEQVLTRQPGWFGGSSWRSRFCLGGRAVQEFVVIRIPVGNASIPSVIAPAKPLTSYPDRSEAAAA